jgi:hypothetical protein
MDLQFDGFSLSSLLLSTSELLGVVVVVVTVIVVVGEEGGLPKRAMPRHRINQSMESEKR